MYLYQLSHAVDRAADNREGYCLPKQYVAAEFKAESYATKHRSHIIKYSPISFRFAPLPPLADVMMITLIVCLYQLGKKVFVV